MPALNGGRFYRDTAAYGHFGRPDLKLPWEDVADKAATLLQAEASRLQQGSSL
jgi:S-adenosylmethionine synthetase